ncbi:TRAP transporter small permease subunit [Nesterenkonia halotolerans]|uniref:TRAP transporter small permease subunit n=1 Tax=Nesterenkonia halotolerans TaxID=225325 RepID=UPI003EE5CB92
MASAFSVVAGLCLLALVLLTVADVVSRNVQGRSILGTVEISTVLLVAIAFLGLGAAEVTGKHVSVSLIEARLPHLGRLGLSALRALLLAGVGALLILGLTEVYLGAVERAETTNGVLGLATAPWKLILVISFLVFFILALWREVHQFFALRRGSSASGVKA